jgi:hypothetical protein
LHSQTKKGVGSLDNLVKLFRDAEASKFKVFTFTQVSVDGRLSLAVAGS